MELVKLMDAKNAIFRNFVFHVVNLQYCFGIEDEHSGLEWIESNTEFI